jgi:hypothetical protein
VNFDFGDEDDPSDQDSRASFLDSVCLDLSIRALRVLAARIMMRRGGELLCCRVHG